MKPTQHIGISLGNVKTWHDGLGEFSLQLCQQLASLAPEWKSRFGIQMHFHLPEKFHGFAGDAVSYLPTRDIQRLLHWSPKKFALWHTLHQFNRFRVPISTAHRLLTVHDLNFLYEEAQAPRALQRRLARVQRIVNGQDTLIVSTDYVRRDLLKHLKVRDAQLKVIPLGVRDLSTSPQEAISALENRDFLFHLSRMAPSKGIHHLVDLAKVCPERHFVFAGPDSPYAQALRARIQTESLQNITLLSNISNEQKAWLYNHCQAFLFPSLTEGFGLPPIEAMCFGKPVFLSNRTCLPEIGGSWAHYWNDLDPASMKACLEQALSHSGHSPSDIQVHGRSFTWERCGRMYAQTYLEALGLSDA